MKGFLLLALGGVASAQPQRREDVMKRSPTVEMKGAARIWSLERNEGVGARLIEIQGPLPLHLHPDSTERIFVIEGELEVEVNGVKTHLVPGDYMQIPEGARHRVKPSRGQRRAWIGTVDVPPADPSKTIWIEPAPVTVRHPD